MKEGNPRTASAFCNNIGSTYVFAVNFGSLCRMSCMTVVNPALPFPCRFMLKVRRSE